MLPKRGNAERNVTVAWNPELRKPNGILIYDAVRQSILLL